MELRRRCSDTSTRHAVLNACAASFLYWVNAFCWTYRQRTVDANGREIPVTGSRVHVPFITWPVQDEVMTQMLRCIPAGEDVNLDKSREMGATWLMMALCDWYLLFKKGANVGVVSRKEILVDNPGDMDSLFEKVRYINSMLPPWMLPRMRTRFMFIQNLEQGSTIIGESTNQDVGRGGRKAWYFVDEAAAIRNGEEIEAALSQNTACQIWASTARGPNTAFHKRIKEKRGRHIMMPWWRHPEKSQAARQIMSPDGKVRWTSKWYEKLDEKMSRKTRAQEVDMDHGSAGDLFFDPVELERHRQDHQASPEFVGDIRPLEEMPESVEQKVLARLDCDAYVFMKDAGRKPWRFWIPLEHGRPPQHWQYIFGVDISNGSGNSNSVISVFSPDAGMIVAKWWDAFTSPEELSMVAARAGAWFGGHSPPPLMVWENNGPGGIFGRKLVLKLGYPHYYRDKAMDVKSPKNSRNSEKWGWSSSPTKKEQMLGLYRDALARNAIIVRCQESLDEAGDYIYVNGVPMPSRLREEVGGGAGLHGDHCIADGLCWLGADESTARRQFQPKAPTGSFAWRRERHLRELKKRED